MDEGGCEFQKKRQMILEKARFEAQLACREYEWHMSIKVNVAPDLWICSLCPPSELSTVVLRSDPTVVCLFAVLAADHTSLSFSRVAFHPAA